MCSHPTKSLFPVGEPIATYMVGTSLNPWRHDIRNAECVDCHKIVRQDRCVGRITNILYSEDIVDKKTCQHPHSQLLGTWSAVRQTSIEGGLSFKMLPRAWVRCSRCSQELILEESIWQKGNILSIVCHACGGDTHGEERQSYPCGHSYCIYCVRKKNLASDLECCPDCQENGIPDYAELCQEASSSRGYCDSLLKGLHASKVETGSREKGSSE